MAARRGAQSLTEAFHGLTLSSQTCRVLVSSSTSSASSSSSPSSQQPRALSTTPSQCKRVPNPSPKAPPFSSATTRYSKKPRMTSSFASTVPPPASAPTTVTSITERTVPVTVFSFPSLEPRSLEMWPAQHLHLPLRRDLLHLAVVYEGDNTRQGTASSKTRWDVHGSHRKMRQQKGSGQARVGTRQSPLLRGGGKTFGPHPRDFGTDLNRKVYDRAWRTALSYRYRRGELIVCEDGLELPLPEEFLRLAQAGTLDRTLEDGFVKRYVRALFNGDLVDAAEAMAALPSVGGVSTVVPGIAAAAGTGIGSIGQAWGRLAGRTTFITSERRPNLFTSLETAGEDGRALALDDVDVKDLLETGRIVIERAALHEMIDAHQSDLVSKIYIHGSRPAGLPTGQAVIG
ncbi:54S ribosomal protein yml6, mitochondrial [Sporothrix stenoceras]|uniref:Large ribosomal subunit protein uL4m n=1 Tax=Sporothrix stenoceras TaxID=5173 RepID=A0ABR3ZIN9_9PEZI